MSVRELSTLDESRARHAKSLALAIQAEQLSDSFIKSLNTLITPYKAGTLPLHFYYQSPTGRVLLRGGVEWRVTPKEEMLTELKGLLGENAVELEFN